MHELSASRIAPRAHATHRDEEEEETMEEGRRRREPHKEENTHTHTNCEKGDGSPMREAERAARAEGKTRQ